MNLNRRAVERKGFDFDGYYALALKALKNPVEHTIFTPSTHASINRVPVPKLVRQASPLAGVFGYLQDGINNLKVVLSNVATLARKAVRDPLVLLFGNLHGLNITQFNGLGN